MWRSQRIDWFMMCDDCVLSFVGRINFHDLLIVEGAAVGPFLSQEFRWLTGHTISRLLCTCTFFQLSVCRLFPRIYWSLTQQQWHTTIYSGEVLNNCLFREWHPSIDKHHPMIQCTVHVVLSPCWGFVQHFSGSSYIAGFDGKMRPTDRRKGSALIF